MATDVEILAAMGNALTHAPLYAQNAVIITRSIVKHLPQWRDEDLHFEASTMLYVINNSCNEPLLLLQTLKQVISHLTVRKAVNLIITRAIRGTGLAVELAKWSLSFQGPPSPPSLRAAHLLLNDLDKWEACRMGFSHQRIRNWFHHFGNITLECMFRSIKYALLGYDDRYLTSRAVKVMKDAIAPTRYAGHARGVL